MKIKRKGLSSFLFLYAPGQTLTRGKGFSAPYMPSLGLDYTTLPEERKWE